jgi:hypothetical protein
MRTKGTYEIVAIWSDDYEGFTAIISDDIVVSPDMRQCDKDLIVDLTEVELLGNGLFTTVSITCLHTLN